MRERTAIALLLVLIALAALRFLDVPVVTSTIRYDLPE